MQEILTEVETIKWQGGDFSPTPGLYYIKMSNGHIYTAEVKEYKSAIVSAVFPEINTRKEAALSTIANLSELGDEIGIKYFARIS